MKTRFVLHSAFSEMILRLHKQAAPDVIAVLFTLLAEETEINGLLTKLIDIKAFLLMLKIANDDTRRSFDDKTSQVAHEVEFWNQSRRDAPNGRTNAPHPRGMMTSRGSLHSSKGKLHQQYSQSILGSSPQSRHPRKTSNHLYSRPRPSGAVPTDLTNPHHHHHTVADIMGSTHREKEKAGRGVKGSYSKDVMRDNHSVASAMNMVEYPPCSTDPRRTLPSDHIPRTKHATVQDMKREMEGS